MEDFELEDVKPYLNKFQLDSAAKANASLNLNEGSSSTIKREDVVNKGSSIFDFPSSSSPPPEVVPPDPPASPPVQPPQRSQPIKRGMTQREVIFDAISELKEKSGCTFKDILRYIELVHQTEIDKKKAAQIKQMLKKCVDNGSLTLVHEKRAGLLINSYRIPNAPEKSIKQLIQMAKAQLTTREKGPGISCGLISWSIGDDNDNQDPFSNLSKSPSPPRLLTSSSTLLPSTSSPSPPHRISMGNEPEKSPPTSISTVKNKPLTLVIKKESVVAPAAVKKEPSTDIKYKLETPTTTTTTTTTKPKSVSSSPLDSIDDAIESAISAPSITIKIKAPQAPQPPIIVVPLNPKPIKKKKKKSLTKKRKSSPTKTKRKSKTKRKKASPKKVKIKVKREVLASAVKKQPPTATTAAAAVKKEKESVVVKKEKEPPVKVTIKKEKEKDTPVKVTIKKEKEVVKKENIPSKVTVKKEKDTTSVSTPLTSAKSRAKAIVVSKTKPKPSPPPPPSKVSPKAGSVSVNKKSTPKSAPKKRKTKAKPKSRAKAKGKSKKTKSKKGGKRQPRVHIK